MKKLFSDVKRTKTISSATFLLFVVIYSVSLLLHIPILPSIFGIPLLLYYSGSFLLVLLPILGLGLGRIGRFSSSVLYSFIFSCLAGYVCQNTINFNSSLQVWIIVFANLLLFVLSLLLPRTRIWQKTSWLNNGQERRDYIIDKKDFTVIIIFATAALVPIIISPIAQNADNYLVILKDSVANNAVQSNTRELLSNSRPLFISFLALTGKFLALDLAFVFRNLFVSLFVLFSLVFYDYCRRALPSRFLAGVIYLSLLSPAVILTEINIIRPQAAMLSLTLPVMILSIESVKTKNILPALVALMIAVLSLKFHELSIVLTLIAFIALAISLIRLVFIEKKISWKYLVLALIVIAPYFKLYNLGGIFTQVFSMIKYATHFLNGITWRWWFINNYATIDGASLGWSGISAFLYYLYNGLLVLLMLSALFYIRVKNKIRIGLFLILPVIYFIIFFAFAEILPRIGLYFLPNRAWVHVMIAAIIILALYVEAFTKKNIRLKFLDIALVGLIIFGYGGTLYVAKNNVEQVFKEELPVAKYIKSDLPQNAIVISSQDNMTLVTVYGNRAYDRITTDHQLSRLEFDTLTATALFGLSKDEVTIIQPKKVETIETITNGDIISVESTVLQEQKDKINKAIYSGDNPVYFLYSYRKLSGLNNAREYKKEIIDATNKSVYKNLGYPVVFEDKDILLLKIR